MTGPTLRMLAAASMVLAAVPPAALAQDAATWSDIECSQSKLVAPPGLRCRATQEMSGSSNAKFSGSGAGQGVFRNWLASGTRDGVKLYYLGYEAIGARSYKAVYLTLEQEIRSHSPYAKGGRDFTQPAQRNGADFVRFTGAQGEACAAIRKVGPVQSKGYQWVVIANRCVSPGRPISDGEVDALVSSAGFRP